MHQEQLTLETDGPDAQLIRHWVSGSEMVEALVRKAQFRRERFADYHHLMQVLFPKAIANPQSEIVGGTIDEAIEKLHTIEGVGVESIHSFEPKQDCVYMGMGALCMHKIERAVILYPNTPATTKGARAKFASKVLAAFGKSYSGKPFEPQFKGDFQVGGLPYQRYKKGIPTVQHLFPYIKLAAVECTDAYKLAVFTWDDGQGAFARIVGLGISLAPCKSIARNMKRPDFSLAFIYGTMPTGVEEGKRQYCQERPFACTLGCPYRADLSYTLNT